MHLHPIFSIPLSSTSNWQNVKIIKYIFTCTSFISIKTLWWSFLKTLLISDYNSARNCYYIALFISIWPVFCFSCLKSFICILNFLFAFLNYLKTLSNTSVCCTIWIDRTGIIFSLTMFSNYEHFVFTWAILYSIWVFLYVK